jgi:hypothetical protein
MISRGLAQLGGLWVGVWWFMAGMLLERILSTKRKRPARKRGRAKGAVKSQAKGSGNE